MKNDGNSPPGQKKSKKCFIWETGKGVDKPKITRAHEDMGGIHGSKETRTETGSNSDNKIKGVP